MGAGERGMRPLAGGGAGRRSSGGRVAGEEAGDELAQGAVREAVEEVLEAAEAGEERHRPRVAEAEAGGWLAVFVDGSTTRSSVVASGAQAHA